MVFRSFIKIGISLLAILLIVDLSGCCGYGVSCPIEPRRTIPKPPVDVRAALAKQGVQIIETGETFIIVIPSDRLFYIYSANFTPKADSLLNYVVAFIQSYTIVITKVGAYTDNCGSWQFNKALTERQAQRMVAYLTTQGIDSRLIYGVGYGSQFPIAADLTPEGRAKNRRIEIRFRKSIVPPAVSRSTIRPAARDQCALGTVCP